jgi:hypothetical protein
VEGSLFVELQAVGHEAIESGARKMLGMDLLLDRFDEELGHLGRA